jgi:hypothetical protein
MLHQRLGQCLPNPLKNLFTIFSNYKSLTSKYLCDAAIEFRRQLVNNPSLRHSELGRLLNRDAGYSKLEINN